MMQGILIGLAIASLITVIANWNAAKNHEGSSMSLQIGTMVLLASLGGLIGHNIP